MVLAAAGDSMSMSLGVPGGTILIGRPLDISVIAMLDARDDAAALCAEADVFYADNKLSGTRVQITSKKVSLTGRSAAVRIRAAVPIDEPVVSVHLRIGCEQMTERRYVMLADMASSAINSAMLAPPNATAVGAGAAGFSQGAAPLDQGGATASPAAGSADRRRVRQGAGNAQLESRPLGELIAALSVTQKLQRSSVSNAQVARAEKAAANGGARLKLEPLDFPVDRDPQLKFSAELLSVPSSSPQERSAAAALWRALTAQSQDILRNGQQLQALETSIRNLQSQDQSNKLLIDELNGRVQLAKSQRYANPFVYVLAVLLLMALLGLGYFAQRFSRARRDGAEDLPWWRRGELLEKVWTSGSAGAGNPALPTHRGPNIPGVRNKNKATDSALIDLDLNLEANTSGFADGGHGPDAAASNAMFPLSRRDQTDFALSTYPPRAVKAEELFDVQQQADFFVSLGQFEQAIELLRHHIEVNVQTSALVYLDLFDLYHQLDRQAEYKNLQQDFNQRFNANMPDFAFYDDVSPGLDAHQAALTRIEALWPSPKVLDIIEESIFRQPEAGGEVFDLEAYRELLLLYAVAREIIKPEIAPDNSMLEFDLPDAVGDGARKMPDFLATLIQPLSANVSNKDSLQVGSHADPALPSASPRLGLDLDLSEVKNDRQVPAFGSSSGFFPQFAADIPVGPPASAKQPAAAATATATLQRKPSAEFGNLMDFDAVGIPGHDASRPKRPQGKG